MSASAPDGALRAAACVLALALAGLAGATSGHAASNVPDLPIWANPGAWRDSTQISSFDSLRCPGSFGGPQPESLDTRARVVTVRFLRDRATEARPDFGGYRLYRMTNTPDSSKATLIRRFSLNRGSELTWNLSRVTHTSSVSLLPGLGDGTFGTRREVATGVAPVALGVERLNNDAFPDLVVVNQGSDNLTVMRGRENGTFVAGNVPETQDGPVALALHRVLLTDTVLVVTANQKAHSITVNFPVGVSHLPTSYPAGTRPAGVTLADVTGDGISDIIVANEGADSISVFPALPPARQGRFGTRTDFPVGSQPVAVTTADLNGDARQDVVVANRGSNSVSVFINGGAGVLAPHVTYATGAAPLGLAVADVNGDTRPDLVVANSGESSASLLLGDGVGGFLARTDFATGAGPRGVALGDLNGDGRHDLVSANFGSGTISRLLGDGAGGFGPKVDVEAGLQPSAVAMADLTNDGSRDVVVANYAYSLPYLCDDQLTQSLITVNDSVVTYVDPDSSGRYIKVCRDPGVPVGRCNSIGDSVFVLVAPPGPHDGFLTWYSVTIEKRNTTDPDYEDLFLPDTLDNFARCKGTTDRDSCPNLNHKLRNLAGPVEPTAGPTADLERVNVVPNPYRGNEVWDQPGGGEVHFINLPAQALIKIYTAAGDLVRELKHNDTVRDFERWDLKNASGRTVASGIYIYRIEAGSFQFQNRFVVIR